MSIFLLLFIAIDRSCATSSHLFHFQDYESTTPEYKEKKSCVCLSIRRERVACVEYKETKSCVCLSTKRETVVYV